MLFRSRRAEWSELLVQDLFTRDPITVSPDDSPRHAATLMTQHRISCLPVCEDGRVIGIITQFDLLKVVANEGW